MTRQAVHWVASRTPAPPPALAARLTATLADAPGDDDASSEGIAEACMCAAERTLERVLAGDAAGRAVALDLLAADALVTYAFEAASETPWRLADVARDAMRRLSRVAAP